MSKKKRKTFPMPSERMWSRLCRCYELRAEAKKEEERLIEKRKTITSQIGKVDRDSDEGRKLHADRSMVLDDIEEARHAFKFYASKYDETMESIEDPGLFEGDDSDLDEVPPRPRQAPREEPAEGEEGDDPEQTTLEDHLPAGKRGQAPQSADAAWFSIDVRKIGLPDAQAAAVYRGDFRTLGDVVREGMRELEKCDGVTPFACSYIAAVIEDLHAGADLEAAVKNCGAGNIGPRRRKWTDQAAGAKKAEPPAEVPEPPAPPQSRGGKKKTKKKVAKKKRSAHTR